MIAAVLAAALTAAPSVAPVPPIGIGGAFVRSGTVLDAAAWSRLQRTSVRAADHSGHVASYSGARLADVLRRAGAPVAGAVRGQAARAYVRVAAADGYVAIFTLAELATTQARCAPLLARTRDGVALPAGVGPVQIVAPCDRTHARWVRRVTALSVSVIAKGESR